MIITNKYNLPFVFEQAVKVFQKEYTEGRGKTDFSVSELLKESHEMLLTRKHYDEISEDVTDRLWSLMGQAMHLVLEKAGEKSGFNIMLEKRLFLEIADCNLSGQADIIINDKISDYKMTSVYNYIYKNFDNYTMQLNILRYLAIKNGVEINHLSNVLIFRDWKRSEAERNNVYPQAPIMEINIAVMQLEEIEKYIIDKILNHKAALAFDNAVECSAKNKWASEASFKVMKEGGKRAIKVFTTREDAEKFSNPEHVIIEKEREYKKCKNYCPVRAFCEYNIYKDN